MDKNDVTFLKTGTTTVGIICKDVVILAADKRATAGNLIVIKDTEKVFSVMGNMGITTAGTVSDIQLTVKYLKAELNLKEVRTGRKPTVKEAATLLSGMNYTNIRQMGGICQFLFAGYDNKGPQLFDIYPDGSITNISADVGFVASGSGSVFAFGVLEDSWKKDMTEEQGVELAFRAVNAALQRDTASGEGIDVLVIDKNGAKKILHKVLSKKLN
ncbi:proteasome subunit beta [Candidatus Woesearchaeota archaeon CG10_big_fil_rev_8_21_14_0_10_32_9]|nr:MAG: proteasome subunit beta [Candidatus Woesearchaeota archaeon CG10_big_fil_rev_8_21_14_0_10_32_9]